MLFYRFLFPFFQITKRPACALPPTISCIAEKAGIKLRYLKNKRLLAVVYACFERTQVLYWLREFRCHVRLFLWLQTYIPDSSTTRSSRLLHLSTELIRMICCTGDFKYLSDGNWYTNKATQLSLIHNLRLTCHHLYEITREIWTETFKNRVSLAGFSLDSRSLAVLLHIAKDSLLLSKLQAVRFYRARIFSYQDRLDYERSPELVHLLVAVLSALQRAKTPIYVEAWAGFEAFTTAVRTVDYDPTSFSVVAVTGFDKRDMMDRTWDKLRVLQPQSVCLDAAKHWGPGNHHLHDPACGKKLAGLDELMATVSRTVETLTVRQSWPSYLARRHHAGDGRYAHGLSCQLHFSREQWLHFQGC